MARPLEELLLHFNDDPALRVPPVDDELAMVCRDAILGLNAGTLTLECRITLPSGNKVPVRNLVSVMKLEEFIAADDRGRVQGGRQAGMD